MQILVVVLIYKYTGYLNKQVVPGSYIEMDIFGDNSKMRRIDFGLNFGIGYKLPFGMFARAQYGLSMFNLSKDDNFVVRNIGFSFSAGYIYTFKTAAKPKIKAGVHK